MEYKRYLNYNVIYRNGNKEIQNEKFPKQNPIIYFVSKLGKIADKLDDTYKNKEELDGKKLSNEIEVITNNLLDEFLYKIDFFSDKLFNDYNSNFSFAYKCDKNMIQSPFEMYKNEMDNFYKNKNQYEEQTNIEKQLKGMQLFNRCAHIMEEFEQHVLKENVNKSFYNDYKDKNEVIDINKEYAQNPKFKREYDKRLKKYKKTVEQLYEKCRQDNITIKYVNHYEKLLNKKITFEELKKTEESKCVGKCINSIEEKNLVKFTYDNIYLFFRISDIQEKMYESKNMALATAVRDYSCLENNSEKHKYKITKNKDRNKTDNDSYKNVISFNIEGYNSPYSVHSDSEMVSELESQLNEMNIEMEEGAYRENQILQYKYTEEQKEKILKFEKSIIRSSAQSDSRYERFSKIVNEICENIRNKSKKDIELT